MKTRTRILPLTVLWLTAVTALVNGAGGIVDEVRTRLARNDFAGAAAAIQTYRKSAGVTADGLEAMSWMARGELARQNLDQAAKWAEDTYTLAAAEWKKHPVARDPNAPLALALGAAIEVEGRVTAARGQRADAVAYLTGERQKYAMTPIRIRIQKVINELSLEGKPAPALAGVTLPKGRPALVFFWAHWCPDCKQEEHLLAQVAREYASKGLVIIAPTQRYGYVANGDEAGPAQELKYIDQIRHQFYADLLNVPAPISEANFRNYGASTTPTLVFIDRRGIVRVYHPGAMTLDELRAALSRIG